MADDLEAYITPDLTIAGTLPPRVEDELLVAVVGDLEVYPIDAVFAIQKRQWTRAEYREGTRRALDEVS